MTDVGRMSAEDLKVEIQKASAVPEEPEPLTLDYYEEEQGEGWGDFLPPGGAKNAEAEGAEDQEGPQEPLYDWHGEAVTSEEWDRRWEAEHMYPWERGAQVQNEAMREAEQGAPIDLVRAYVELSAYQEAQRRIEQNLVNSLKGDFAALADRYNVGKWDLVDRFKKDLEVPGKVQIRRGLEKEENALEIAFLDWAEQSGILKKLTRDEFKEFVDRLSQPAVRTRTLDYFRPAKSPARKPSKPKPSKPKEPELDGDDMIEFLKYNKWAHPEKWVKGKTPDLTQEDLSEYLSYRERERRRRR